MTPDEREQMIDGYLETLATIRRARERAGARDTEQGRIDRELLAGMERDLLWTIEYLESGHVPDFKRGAYKWVVPVDPHKLRCMAKVRSMSGESDWVTSDVDLDQLLSVLTPREREAFVLIRGHNCTYRETARYMRVSDGTVSSLVRRAERKVRKASVRQFVAHQTQ